MSTKIESYGPQAPAAPGRVRAPDSTGSSSAGRGPVGAIVAADSVRLTDDAVLLQQLRQTLSQSSAVDGARVAETRQAMAEGRYQVDAHAIADKLMRLEWELGRP